MWRRITDRHFHRRWERGVLVSRCRCLNPAPSTTLMPPRAPFSVYTWHLVGGVGDPKGQKGYIYILRQKKGQASWMWQANRQWGSGGVWGWITGELVHGSEWITRHGSPNPIISLLLQRGLKFMSAHAASSLEGGCHSSSGCGRTGQAGPRRTRPCLIPHQPLHWGP